MQRQRMEKGETGIVATNNVIELNGKSYDALSGAMLGNARRPEQRVAVAAIKPIAVPRADGHVRSLDGFVKPQQANKTTPHVNKSDVRHIAAHQPQPTKTLMRRAVSGPHANGIKRSTEPAIRLQKTLQPVAPVAFQPKLSANSLDPRRAQRASSVDRSHLVKHFTPLKTAALDALSLNRPKVDKASDTPAAAPAISPPVGVRYQAAPNRSLQDMRRPSRRPQAASLSQQPTATQPSQSYAKPPVASASFADDDNDIFAQALAQARSHEEPAPHESTSRTAKRHGKKHRRIIGIAASVAVFVGLCGFVAYQNKMNIQLQMASAKAGFSASVPLYKPEGYHLDKLAASTGNVAANFLSDNNQKFTITQKKSNWDSQTLLENYVATTDQPYQGYQSGGRTIYVYGEGNATWVNGGIWYQIKDAKDLTSDQLVKVAASM